MFGELKQVQKMLKKSIKQDRCGHCGGKATSAATWIGSDGALWFYTTCLDGAKEAMRIGCNIFTPANKGVR